jgi:hypothetical protein
MSYVGGTEPVPVATWATPFAWAVAVFTPPALVAHFAFGADLAIAARVGGAGVVVALVAFLAWCVHVERWAKRNMANRVASQGPSRPVGAMLTVVSGRTIQTVHIPGDLLATLRACGLPELHKLSLLESQALYHLVCAVIAHPQHELPDWFLDVLPGATAALPTGAPGLPTGEAEEMTAADLNATLAALEAARS